MPSADQIMAMPAEARRRWSAREVRELIAESPLASPRYELVDGELLVTPSPSWAHQRAVSLLLSALVVYLSHERVAVAVTSPSDVELEPELIVQPDVFVVSREENRRLVVERFPAYRLLVAAEVLSPSSGRYDRVTKRPKYQRHVPEYWIVDLEARLIERWTPDDDRPEVLTQSLGWHPPGASEPFRLELEPYFAEIFGEEPDR